MLKYSYKLVGVWMFILTFLTALAINSIASKSWDSTDLPAIILEALGFVSLAIIAFSREKKDDEYLNRLRFKSICITVLFSFLYAILDSFFFGVNHLMIMEVLQIQILLYIVLFNILRRTND